ncbi:MAG: potassium-transporting ATPase subunit C [Acidimicrobiales bacterium]
MRAWILASLYRAVVSSVAFALVLGLGYGLAMTGVAQVLFPFQANGSITKNGSTEIGQAWHGARWFHGRPGPYNPMASGASNLGPRSAVLAARVRRRIAAAHAMGDNHPTEELVVGSGSGLDPDISPAGAMAQVGQVSAACHIPAPAVRKLVASHVRPRQLGFAGEPVVNVLALNEALAVRCRP